MGLDATARRRWLGALALGAALVMLVLGETVLQRRLAAFVSLFYWVVCLGLTSAAILAALLDVRALQERSRREQKELFQSTLHSIETEARKHPVPERKPRR